MSHRVTSKRIMANGLQIQAKEGAGAEPNRDTAVQQKHGVVGNDDGVRRLSGHGAGSQKFGIDAAEDHPQQATQPEPSTANACVSVMRRRKKGTEQARSTRSALRLLETPLMGLALNLVPCFFGAPHRYSEVSSLHSRMRSGPSLQNFSER